MTASVSRKPHVVGREILKTQLGVFHGEKAGRAGDPVDRETGRNGLRRQIGKQRQHAFGRTLARADHRDASTLGKLLPTLAKLAGMQERCPRLAPRPLRQMRHGADPERDVAGLVAAHLAGFGFRLDGKALRVAAIGHIGDRLAEAAGRQPLRSPAAIVVVFLARDHEVFVEIEPVKPVMRGEIVEEAQGVGRLDHGDEIRHERNLQRRAGQDQSFVPAKAGLPFQKDATHFGVRGQKRRQSQIERADADAGDVVGGHVTIQTVR